MDHDPNQNAFYQLLRNTFHREGTSADGGANAAQPNTENLVSQNDSDAHAQGRADVQMVTDFDDMPGLQEVSDSESGDESDRDADEVEMQAVDGNNGSHTNSRSDTPSIIERPSAARQHNNRRPRVDDDDDEERDRRHPSQRVSSSNVDAASSSASAQASAPLPHVQASSPTSGPTDTPHPPARQPVNVQRHIFHTTFNLGPRGPASPFSLLQHLLPNNSANAPNPTNPNTHNTDNHTNNAGNNDNNSAPGAPPTYTEQPPQPPNDNNGPRPHPLMGGIMSVDLGHGVLFGIPTSAAVPPTDPAAGGTPGPNGQPQGFLAELLSHIGAQVMGGMGSGFGLDNQEDPERARKLVDGLEVVPEGLVRRLERVGGSGGGMGEDSTKGGDSGCAICWDRLLDTDGEGFGRSEPAEGSSPAETEKKQPKIVSLPCAHVFHADCLIPWFSRPRQTTCPTCRFNIDPDNLTYVPFSVRQRERREAEAATTRAAGGDEPAAAPSAEPAAESLAIPDIPFLNPSNFPASVAAPPVNETETRNDNDRDQLMRQFSSSLTGTNPDLAAFFNAIGLLPPLPANTEAQRQETQQATPTEPPQHVQQQPRPAVGVASIPLPIPIPVAIPLAGIHTAPNPTTPVGLAESQPSQANASDESTEPLGESRRLYHRLFGPDFYVPLVPPRLYHLGDAGTSTSADTTTTTGTTAPTTTGTSPPEGPTNPPLPTPRPFNPGLFWGSGGVLGPQGGAVPNIPPFTVAPRTGPRQPQTNTFNLEGVNLGIPGLRADVVVTMDMFFDHINPRDRQPRANADGAQADADDDLPPLVPMVPSEGDMEMEDVMMLMPEDGEIEQEEEHFRNMMDMLAGRAPPPAGNAAGNGQQPSQTALLPADQQLPPPPPGFRMAAGTGRTAGEAFERLLALLGTGGQQGQAGDGEQDPHAQPQEGGAPAQPTQPGDTPMPGVPPQRRRRPPFWPGTPGPFIPNLPPFENFGAGRRAPRPQGPKPAWTLPAAPGPTLRQRIERREREAGLRCYDVSCGLGPSDEDPLTDEVSKTVSGMKQLTIRHKGEDHTQVCDHRFHGACLVSAERVFLRGADGAVEDGQIDVSCPVCRGSGCITQEEWNEGVAALQ